MIVQHEERVGPWRPFPHYGLSEVRVWERQTPFGFFQCHEWRGHDGQNRVDDWIPAAGRRQFSNLSQPTAETLPSEPDLMLAALIAIASGHNDARGLAVETLQAIGHQR